MKKHLILLSIVVLFSAFMSNTVFADTLPGGGAASSAYASTGMMASGDLGVEDVGTLPTSKFYFLKEWKRGVSRMFTWSAVSNVELELRITNEKAAELIKVEETKTNDVHARINAMGNFSDATERLEERLMKLKETSDDADVKSLLQEFDKQSLQHATLLQQFSRRYESDPYAEDSARSNIGDPVFDLLRNAIQISQDKNSHSAIIAIEKNTDVKQRAEEQILLAETQLNLLKTKMAEFLGMNATEFAIKHAINTKGTGGNRGAVSGSNGEVVQSSGIAIKEQGVRSVEIAIDEPGVQKLAPIRIDNTPARISTNMTIERQTPKRDFGDRMKAGLETAGGMLANAKTAFAEGKYGEAFGHARSAEVMARGDLRILSEFAIKEQGVKSVNPLHEESSTQTNPLHEDKDGLIIKPTPTPISTGPAKPVACTKEARICPDGTSVGRTGPRCEFTACPTVKPVEPIACTQEAKLCPDGSSVSRTGPRCEFAECPALKPAEGMMCTAQYDPVCGADGKTYGNACNASVAGVSVVAKGECGVKIEASVSVESRSL